MRKQIVVGLALALAIGMGMLPSTQASAYRGYGTYLPRAYGYGYYRSRAYGYYYRPRFYGAYLGGLWGWRGGGWRYRAFSAQHH
jgi:hypothetical protein